MPRRAKELSALEIRRIEAPGLHAVGGVAGLSLQITPSGARSWILRLRIAGRRHELGLGPCSDVPLAMARTNARALADRVRRGEGLVLMAERRAARQAAVPTMSVTKAMEEWLKVKLAEIEGEKNQKRYRSVLDTYVTPVIGNVGVADATMADVLKVLEPLWATRTETATKIRERLEAMFAFAQAHRWRADANPATWKGNLSAVLPAPSKIAKTVNQPALAIDDAPWWFAALRKRPGTSARALELLALTAVRSGELRGMRWKELELDSGVWTIPAERMKMKREHRVPLPAAGVELLKQATPRNPV